MSDILKRAVVWKNISLNGTEYCALWQTPEGWLLKGRVVGVLKDRRPVVAEYEIHCDQSWLTHRVSVERTIGSETRSLSLNVDGRVTWRSSTHEFPVLSGCLDVDLALTPATNTLPVRRLGLQTGASESVMAAWVRFPDLTIEPLSQTYTSVGQDTYRYSSNTGFTADISVDELGLVISYPGGWEQIASS